MAQPILNLSALTQQIQWAETSERMAAGEPVEPELLKAFRGWGSWNQAVWARIATDNACGTAYCQAGQAAVQAGYKIIFSEDGSDSFSCYNPDEIVGRTPRGFETANIREVAAEYLGLSDQEADRYFDGTNTIDRLKYLVDMFALSRGLPAPYWSDDV